MKISQPFIDAYQLLFCATVTLTRPKGDKVMCTSLCKTTEIWINCFENN